MRLTQNERDLMLVDIIVKSTGARQAKAYEELFNKYFPIMFRFVRGRYRSLREDEAQDAAIEGLTKAFKVERLTEYEPTHNFSTWLFTAVNHKVIDILRKEKKADTQYIEDMTPEENTGIIEVSIEHMTPDRVMQSKETFDLIKFCIGKLSNSQKDIVELSLIQELNDKEIVSRLWGDDLSDKEIESKCNTVRATVHRGKKALQKLLLDEGMSA